jgi:uncharacterized protein
MSETDLGQELITLPATWHLEFEHAAGRAASRFLVGLRDRGILLASPCPKCRTVYMPPRSFCEACFVRTTEEWVEVGPHGCIEASTIGYAQFPGYPTPPYALAYVRLEGASTAMCNFVHGVELTDPVAASQRLSIGTPVSAVIHEERIARITDFHWQVAEGSPG